MQIDKSIRLFGVDIQIYRSGSVIRIIGHEIKLFGVEEQNVLCNISGGAFKLRHHVIVHIVDKAHLGVKDGYFVILVIDYRLNRIADSEAGQQKCCTAANAYYHHYHALFVSQDIPDGNLVQELNVLPDKVDSLNQYTLTSCGRLGTYQ